MIRRAIVTIERWLALALVLLVACAPPPLTRPSTTSPSIGSAPTTDVVRFAWPDVGVPTPFRISTAGPGGAVLLTFIYDTLTWKNATGIVPWLATGWDVSSDGREYTFAIAQNVSWHDGQRLTAEDVAFSFDYYGRHPYRWTSTDVVESASVVANGVRVRLKRTDAAFLEQVAGTVPIIPKHIWSTVTDPATYDAANATIGSGPFKLAEYRSAEGAYRLLANPTYFHGQVTARELQQVNVPAATSLPALEQGQVDLFFSADASIQDLVRNQPRIKVFEAPPFSIVRLAVNSARPPLDRRDVREAIMDALDRAKIARTVIKGPPIVGSAGVIPPESPWYNPEVKTYAFNPDRARALLGGQKYTIELLADPTNREPELMAPMLADVGITLVTKRLDNKTRIQLMRERNFQLALTQHVGVGGDPDFLRQWYGARDANDFAQGLIFQNPEFERLGLEQATAIDPAARKKLVFRMQDILAEELPTIVLYHRRFYWAYDSTKLAPMYTWGGLMVGIPFVQNKLIFLRQ